MAKRITYYAFARNDKGQIEQLFVERGSVRSQSWTGKIYKSVNEAEADMERLSCRKGE